MVRFSCGSLTHEYLILRDGMSSVVAVARLGTDENNYLCQAIDFSLQTDPANPLVLMSSLQPAGRTDGCSQSTSQTMALLIGLLGSFTVMLKRTKVGISVHACSLHD